jgi:hypothetical protein
MAVFLYQAAPIRVADTMDAEWGAALRQSMGESCNIERTIRRWATVVARLLNLGYVPYAPWNAGWGACVDAGNACIDGGVADLLTLVPCDLFPNDHVLVASVHASVDVLTDSVAKFLAATQNMRQDGVFQPLVRTYVRGLVAESMASESFGQCHNAVIASFRINDARQIIDMSRSFTPCMSKYEPVSS